MTIDAASHVLPQESATTRELPGLLGLDFDDALEDDADMILGCMWQALVIEGDVTLSGDVRSRDIASHLATAPADLDRHHTVIVLGDLTVDGMLTVDQYNDLLVKGAVRARSLQGGSANLVATGPITVAKLLLWRESEEGGVLYGTRVDAGFFVRDAYTDIETRGTSEYVGLHDDDKAAALIAAVEQVSEERPKSVSDYALVMGIREACAAGRYDALVAAYRAARGEGRTT